MSPFIYIACPFSTIFISDYLINKRFNTICFDFFLSLAGFQLCTFKRWIYLFLQLKTQSFLPSHYK